MWRFLVDEDMPRTAAGVLRQAGYIAEDVRDVGLRGRSDQAIFEYAQAHNSIIVTADTDFANVLDYPLGTHPGIIVLRLPNRPFAASADVGS